MTHRVDAAAEKWPVVSTKYRGSNFHGCKFNVIDVSYSFFYLLDTVIAKSRNLDCWHRGVGKDASYVIYCTLSIVPFQDVELLC